MDKKIHHSSIRISELEKEFLDSTGTSVLAATRIGLQVLKMSVQSGANLHCIYLSRTAECDTQSEAPCVKAPTPSRAPGQAAAGPCCPSCPIKNGFAKRFLSPHCHGMNDPALNPSLIDDQETGSSLRNTIPEDRCACYPDPSILFNQDPSSAEPRVTTDIDELLEEEPVVIAHELEPAGPAIAIERILNMPPAAIRVHQVSSLIPSPALDREIMDRLKKERASS